MDDSRITKFYNQVYRFPAVADLDAPKAGQIAIVTQTPDFGTAHILLVTDGTKTIRQLYNAWKTSQVTPSALMDAITAETQNRISADASLQQQITALQQAANRALVFENHAELEYWMNNTAPLPPPNPPYTPADLQIGWQALFRDPDMSDLWWDGTEWLEHEVHIDLSGYRTAAEQDVIDATMAPLDSPQFTGIPTVPVPDYTIPEQAAPISEVLTLHHLINGILYEQSGQRRILDRVSGGIVYTYRTVERSPMMRKMERATI
jgi:hypothetical protein